MAPSDEELLSRVGLGDSDAFEMLASRYRGQVEGRVFGMLRDHDAAKDIAQEVLLRVWTHSEQWRGTGSCKAWLMRIATNLALNHLGSVARRGEPASDEADDEPTCATGRSSDEPDVVLWELAKTVDGWGRIHIVERLAETERPEIKDWLLREGYRNSIMYEYLAYTCATAGNLLTALSGEHVDRDLLTSAGDIIQALISGGPAEDMDGYEEGATAVTASIGVSVVGEGLTSFDSSVRAEAEAVGIDAAEDTEEIINAGGITADATAVAAGINVSVSSEEGDEEDGEAGVWDGSTEAIAVAKGIDAGEGAVGNFIRNSGDIEISATVVAPVSMPAPPPHWSAGVSNGPWQTSCMKFSKTGSILKNPAAE